MPNSEWLNNTIFVEGGMRGEMLIPRKIMWRNKLFSVISVGRQWKEETETHLLVELHDGSRLEVIFSNERGWRAVRYWSPPMVA